MASAWWERLAADLTRRDPAVTQDGDRTRAAVLVPLQRVGDVIQVVYTRRAQTLPHHRGQVAFPGGIREPKDATLESTALREAEEEVGLAPSDVRIIGRLDDIETVSSRFVISPFVGVVPHPYAWTPEPAEVDAIFSVTIAELVAPGAERTELWDFGGRKVPIDHFPVQEHVIWGATHRITRNLLELMRST